MSKIDTGGPALGLDQRFTWLDAFAMMAMTRITENWLPMHDGELGVSDEQWAVYSKNIATRCYSLAQAMLAEKRRLEGEE